MTDLHAICRQLIHDIENSPIRKCDWLVGYVEKIRPLVVEDPPVKYARDCMDKTTIGDILDKVEAAGDDDEACDILDREFLHGAWGHVMSEIRERHLFGKDLRGIIIAALRRR